MKLIVMLLLLLFINQTQTKSAVATNGELWLDVSLGQPLVGWFNGIARPDDIARLDNISQLNLLDQIIIGRKLLVFKSAAEAEHLLPDIAERVDMVGYNLEHNPANPADEQANPVASVQRMRALADQYDLLLAFGPDHDFALSHGVEIAPYVDIFVLQVQRVQTDPETVYDFVLPLIPQLREANPELQVSIQVRTEGDVGAITALITSLEADLDGVSILTSPDTVPVAEELVAELQGQMEVVEALPEATAVPDDAPVVTAEPTGQRSLIWGGGLLALLLVGLMAVFLILSRDRG